MIKNFTENDILLYIYGEVDALEAEHIEIALLVDNELNNFFLETTYLKSAIDTIKIAPCEQIIEKIIKEISL